MIVCLDTETTGLPDWRNPSDAPQQPHLVQLALILLSDDFTEHAHVSLVIKPDGWTIPDDVAAIHGITTAEADRIGVPEKLAARLYASMVYTLGARPIGHNVKFDLRIMRIALLRSGYTKGQLDSRELDPFCTMTAAAPLVNLPPTDKMKAAGFTKPKPPSLTECIRHFFGEELDGAHDAMVDVRACLRVYRHLHTAPLVAPVEDVI